MGRGTGLALNETVPFLPYGRQSIATDDVAAVVEVLRSDFLTTGPAVEAFESALAEYCGAKHAIAVANGTAALHVAVLAVGVQPGQRVITSANTFLASANCAEYVGGVADFADIDARTYCLTPETLEHAWKEDVHAVIAVDFAGQPSDMPTITKLARQHKALVIADSCHAIGAGFEFEGKEYLLGAHPWADLTCFSFHPVKTITTAEGGAILTDNDELAERCRRFRNHGMTKEPKQFRGLGSRELNERGPWYYEMPEIGYNYRLTDLQCALGINQTHKLRTFIKRRAEIVALYNEAFAGLANLTLPYQRPGTSPAWHLYVLQIDFGRLGKSRSAVMKQLRERGIGSQVHYIPVHLQPYYREKYGYETGKCPVSESYYQRCLSIPLYAGLSDDDVQRVIEAVRMAVSA
jgi:perosamine synthetase